MSVLTNLDDTIWIDLPDGRQLSARLWLPKTGHSYPVIFEYLPYRKRDGTAERDATTHAHFVKHGYASIRVDIAGTGDSYGQFDDEYSEQELTDGEAVLDWISSQDWCDGAICITRPFWGRRGQSAFHLPHRHNSAAFVSQSIMMPRSPQQGRFIWRIALLKDKPMAEGYWAKHKKSVGYPLCVP